MSFQADSHYDNMHALWQYGRAKAAAWLDDNYASVGVDSSIDLQRLFF